ncbi:MAG: ammonium transporter [Alphaproteobacteria bacterium]|nr:ammonium transporter [Alphaproteobacteria bacterium]
MTASIKRIALVGTGVAAISLVAMPAMAETAPETSYIFNTLSFLLHGFLVMWMAAGFAMLEAGLVRSKNTATQCLKNIGIYSIAGIMFYIVGYNLMYIGVDGGYFGSFTTWSAGPVNVEDGYSAGSDWFFQMVFVATTASIVSGTVAERAKLWPFFLFTAILTAVIYPIQGSWSWGGGWLSELGFLDFAGSTIVHSVGGWAALAGAIVIGARKGRYGEGGHPMPGSNLPLATLGTFVLWLGWFGFNGGSQLAMGTPDDVAAIGTIYINTNLAAAAGCVVAMVLTQILYKKIDLTMALNGALAGLVSITAEPLAPTPGIAILVGAIGGIIVVFAVPMIDKLKIDDVVGAIPVHLLCGIWGTIAVVISNGDATIGHQLTGIVAVGAFVFIVSMILWTILKLTVGVRVSEEEEMLGLDKADLGMEAYPEFGAGSTSK